MALVIHIQIIYPCLTDPFLCAISGRTGPGQATQRCHVLPARGEEVADILLQETGITQVEE